MKRVVIIAHNEKIYNLFLCLILSIVPTIRSVIIRTSINILLCFNLITINIHVFIFFKKNQLGIKSVKCKRTSQQKFCKRKKIASSIKFLIQNKIFRPFSG